MQSKKWIKPTVISVLAVVALALSMWGAYEYGVKKTTDTFNSVQVDSTRQVALDSLFQDMLSKIDSTSKTRKTVYQRINQINQQIIQTYAKADSIRPYTDRDSIINSLTRISNTK